MTKIMTIRIICFMIHGEFLTIAKLLRVGDFTPWSLSGKCSREKTVIRLFLADVRGWARSALGARAPDNLGFSHAWIMGNLANAPHLAPHGFA